MYLKEIVIDGFKSYATRTVVHDFDRSFNAITGLNGSGKSNVLDSICFVLGISNLSQVRASSLQDLVYKGGLAGVTKATVSLIFNNTDKSKAPVGYEQPDEITITRQIVIGGRNRYLINGINAQPNRVQNLFHSIGLNVNNPHFLIMQGRITKVINMKPPEVLSMIEEAAGTKMYENKKEAALRTMEKKQRKVDEINLLLEEKINPSLAKLQQERKHYLEWNKNNNEMDALRRYLVAYKYLKAIMLLERSSGEGSGLHGRVNEIDRETKQWNEQQADAKRNLDALVRTHTEREDSGNVEERQLQVEGLSKKLVKLRSAWVNQKAALDSEEKTLVKLEDSISELRSKSSALQAEFAQAELEVPVAEKKLEKATKDLEMAEMAILTGASSQDASGTAAGTGSIIDQLDAARRAVSMAQTEIESLRQQESHLTNEYQAKSAELAKDRANVRVLEAKKRAAEKAVTDAKVAVHELDFDAEEAESTNGQLREEQKIVSDLRERLDALSARLESCDFHYSDPYPNFDRKKVFSIVARLINVRDPRMTTAVEITAGGRLYQVVVDTDSTANDLIKRGRLARRITFLPLDKIWHEVLHDSKIHRAKQIEPSTELAISCVSFDSAVTNAIEHVFGRTLICPNLGSAQRVTFDDRVRARTVTLEGDTYDPSGTASGGSSTRQGPSVLALLGEWKSVQAELSSHASNVERLSLLAGKLGERGRQFRQFQATVEVREAEFKQLEQQLSETSTGRLIKEVELLKTKLGDEILVGLQKAKETFKEQSKKVKELEELMKNSDAAKKKAQEEADAAMSVVRKEHSEASQGVQQANDRVAQLKIDLEAIMEELKRLEDEAENKTRPSVAQLREDASRKEDEVVRIKKEYDVKESELKKEREQIALCNQAVAEAKREYEEIGEKIEALSLEKAKLDSKLRESERGRSGAEKLVKDLETKHTWIEQEKEMFGQEGSEYEFTDERVLNSKKTLETLEQRQEGLAKRINKKAMHMFETANEEYQNLINKKKITEQDKEKIEMVIAGLDEKKMVAVQKTWRKVNEDFGNIFSDLLPGTSAKLDPPEGQTVNDGLEIRVGFGGVWKDSLSELSGGQRSLIALSLILAMLRFKPAPMYILDEVDAALDLSHTQNIGRMLRRHFSGSQFIVVSLKEGMFSNANVIFRTKFVDGVSTIRRTQNEPNGNARTSERMPLREIGPSVENGRTSRDPPSLQFTQSMVTDANCGNISEEEEPARKKRIRRAG